MARVFSIATILVVVTLICCSHQDNDPADTYQWLLDPTNQEQILVYARSHIQWIAEFKTMFPLSQANISSSFPKSPSTRITCQALVYGKYYVQLTQRVRTKKDDLSAKPLGSLDLTIWEILSLGRSPGGSWSISYDTHSGSFGDHDWQRLCEAKGDLAVLIPLVDKNHPLPLAERYATEMYSP